MLYQFFIQSSFVKDIFLHCNDFIFSRLNVLGITYVHSNVILSLLVDNIMMSMFSITYEIRGKTLISDYHCI